MSEALRARIERAEGVDALRQCLHFAQEHAHEGEALTWLAERHRRAPLPTAFLVHWAAAHVVRGELDVARALVEKAEHPAAQMLAAELAEQRDELVRALAHVERALGLDVDTLGARSRRTRLLRALTPQLAQPAPPPHAPHLPSLDAYGGRYTLHAVLGRGGAATVFRAEEHALQRQIALKQLHDGPERRERARREIEHASALRHPRCVTLLAHDADAGWLAYEWIARGSLRDRLARGGPPQPLRPWLLELSLGLAYVHHAGFVHGDLKPANVLLGERDWPRLSDFGSAVRAGEPLRDRTERYAVPAHLAHGAARPWHDVYAFGVTLDELLAHGAVADGELAPLQALAARCREPDALVDGLALWRALSALSG